MDTCLKKVSCAVRDFDDDLVRRFLQSVKVISEDMCVDPLNTKNN